MLAEVNASIAIGANHSVILKTNGSLWTVGNNDYGQIGDGTNNNTLEPKLIDVNVTKIASGSNHILYLKDNKNLHVSGEIILGN